jgi:HAE1 family hydrophobic/amphiphilic exporter-1
MLKLPCGDVDWFYWVKCRFDCGFAIQRRCSRKSMLEAAMEGAKARFRPILMTSFAFIAGLLPLVFATGARKMVIELERPQQGMLIGTICGVLPGLYCITSLVE